MAKLFLSYDREDSARAASVAQALERAGHQVWWDRQIKGGAEFSKQIEQALELADVVVVLWSSRSIESAWVRDEAAAGRDKGKLVPATLDGTLPPLGFRQLQTVDLSGGPVRRGSKRLAALVDAISERVSDERPAGVAARAPVERSRLTRRAVVGGLVLSAGGGAAYLLLKARAEAVPSEVEPLLEQGMNSWLQGDAEGNNQAIGIYRRVTELAPDFADGWALLGAAYADRAHWWVTLPERPAIRERAREAAQRALQLEPRNANARAAIAYARPFRGSWLLMEREYRRALKDQPGTYLVTYSLALLLTHVGRMKEAADLFAQLRGPVPQPNQTFFHAGALLGSGQLSQAERLVDSAATIYATHPRIWGLRYDLALVGGRPAAALAMAQDVQARPSRVSDAWLERRAAVARVLTTGNVAERSAVVNGLMEDASGSAGSAVRSLQELALLDARGEAFAVAQAYFFSRGFIIPDAPVVAGRSPEVTMESRFTTFLFLPATRTMRSDGRFARLVEELGLESYWRKVGVQPDYRRT